MQKVSSLGRKNDIQKEKTHKFQWLSSNIYKNKDDGKRKAEEKRSCVQLTVFENLVIAQP